MKPRNKFEKAVLEQSKHLRSITKTQSKWTFHECIDHFAYHLLKGRTTCMDCRQCTLSNKSAISSYNGSQLKEDIFLHAAKEIKTSQTT